MKLAAIDIGSNSIKLAVVEAATSDSFAVLMREKEVVRLGHETLANGRLSPEAIERAVNCIQRFRTTAEARQAGIVPLFITAPSNHVRGHEPAYLARRHLRVLDELVPLHEAYVAATRRIAGENGVLCDAAAAFAAVPHDGFFRADGIHLTDAGDQEMAATLSQCIVRVSKTSESSAGKP